MLAPGVFVEVDSNIIDSVSEAPIADLGHYEISQDPADRWKYKTPTLRNVAITAPYMHNGSLPSLRAVIEFYNQGGVANPGLDPLITPLNLDATEIDQLVAFLQSLTGNNVDTLVSDAFAAPIGDTVVTPDTQPTPKTNEPKTQKTNTVGGDFTLTDHHGKSFNLTQLRGKIVLIFFGYTHCPDVCPTELARMAQLLKQLGDDADKVQGLFISVDPERDTPAILSQYVPYFHTSLIGLTGSQDQVQAVADAYRTNQGSA
jgi:cytochrome c peroxidase